MARELTKLHEEIFRGTISQSLAHFSQQAPRGEITLVVAGKTAGGRWSEAEARLALRQRLANGDTPAQAAGELSAGSGWPQARAIPPGDGNPGC